MATPLGHALAGWAISSVYRTTSGRNSLIIAAASIFSAMAPDLDVVPGILQGQPVLYHGGPTHSLFAGLLFSLIVGGLLSIKHGQFLMLFTLFSLAYGSHLLLDFIGPDGREPFGIPLLWPFTDKTYLSPTPLLLGMRHAADTNASINEFVSGVLSFYNVMAILLEMALIGGTTWMIRLIRFRQSSLHS